MAISIDFGPYTVEASETNKGIINIASAAEVLNGENTNKAITPKTAADTYLKINGGTMSGDISTQDLVPSTNNVYNIGTVDKLFNNIYATNFVGHLNGNADTSTKLATSRTISLSGVTATSQNFDGSANITIPITAVPSSLLTGTIDIARIPAAALDRLIIVANETARFALTVNDIQLGDTVKQTDTGLMYYVKDINNLSNVNGYELYSAGAASTAIALSSTRTFALTGDITGTTNTDLTTGLSINTTLSNSGVSAGSYGLSANASPSYGVAFNVPYITVDSKGRITSASTKTVTLPVSDNTDTKVTNTLNTTTKYYITGTTSNNTNTDTQIFDSGVYVDTTAGKLCATTIQQNGIQVATLSGTEDLTNKTYNGYVLANASTKTAGAVVGNVPLVGTDLGTTINNLVGTDANGNLIPIGIVSTNLKTNANHGGGAISAGSVGSATSVPILTYDSTGHITAVNNAAITPANIGASSIDHTHISTLTWSNGTTSGPTIGFTGSNISANAVAIPSASATVSGVITTGTQTIAGAKTFNSNIIGNLSGNSSTATKLANIRNVSLIGDVTGTGTFDGSADLSITATIADDSHNHTIANIDNLQDNLNNINISAAINKTNIIATNNDVLNIDNNSSDRIDLLSASNEIVMPSTTGISGLKTIISGMTMTNLISCGNFENTTDFVTYTGTMTAADNILTHTANDVSYIPIVFYKSSINSGHKIFVKAKVKVNNSVCSRILLELVGNTSGAVMSADTGNIVSPTADTWYTLYYIFDTSTFSGTLNFKIDTSYADATTANGKIMYIKEWLAVDLTALGLESYTSVQLNDMTYHWFDNTANVLSQRIKTVNNGKVVSAQYNEPIILRRLADGTVDTIEDGIYIQRVSNDGLTALPTPIVTNNVSSGTLISYPSGTIYAEPVLFDYGVYDTNISITKTDYPISSLETIYKINSNGTKTLLDVADAVVVSDGLSFTHAGLTNNDFVQFTYYYEYNGLYGLNTYSYNIANASVDYADAKVADSITNNITDIAPSQNAVYEALSLKANLASPTFTGTVTAPNITGNITSADKLSTARNINLNGDVSGTGLFDGSDNITITTTVADDSHNHTNYEPINNIYTSTTDGTVNWFRIATIPMTEANKSVTFKIKAYTTTGTTSESTVWINMAYYSGNYSQNTPAIMANTSHSYNSDTYSETGWVIKYVRVSFDSNYGYIDIYASKSSYVTMEVQPLFKNYWSWNSGSLTAGVSAGVYINRYVILYNGISCPSGWVNSSSMSTVSNYCNYGILGGNTRHNTDDKTGQWEYIGNIYLEYNSNWLNGKSIVVNLKIQELSPTGDMLISNMDDFTLRATVNMIACTSSTDFNTNIPTYSLEIIDGKTTLSTSDIALLVYSTSTSAKYLRIYIKLKDNFTFYCINPINRYGRSFASGTTPNYTYFTFALDQEPSVSLPTPVQGEIAYATFDNPNLRNIESLTASSGLLRKTADKTWSLDNTEYAPIASPTFTGTAAAPTFSGALAGNASTATKWTAPITLALSGDVSGSNSIDGSGNVTITTTIADDSHNHIISNIDNLQTELDNTFKKTCIQFVNGDDLNLFTTIGTYGSAVTSIVRSLLNGPTQLNTGTECQLKIEELGTADYIMQTLTFKWSSDSTSPLIFTRSSGTPFSTWTSWRRAATTDGNIASATKLATARTIGLSGVTATGQNFDGTANITIPVTAIPASLLTGTIDIARLPAGAVERCTVVADSTARYALTTATVQSGDTVKEADTGLMYLIVDDTKLSSSDGYIVYNAGNASTAMALSSVRTFALTGDVTGTVDSDLTSGASISTTLSNSGVTAGSYGLSANATPSYSGTFNVPYITIDSKGRITSASTKTVTIPASDNTDTNYYPTAFTWSNGTTSGPTGTLSGTGMSNVSIGSIPSASATVSGVITTDEQTIAGAKTFNDEIHINGLTNNLAYSNTATVTTASTTQTALCTFATATYGSGEFIVQATQGSLRQFTKLLITHDGTTGIATEYGSINTGTKLFTTEVDISSGLLRLLITSLSSTSTVYKVFYTLIGA